MSFWDFGQQYNDGNQEDDDDDDKDSSVENEEYYEVLGIDKTATQHEIKKAYRKIARECMPDRYPNKSQKERFESISKAYEVLKDTDKRKVYDECGSSHRLFSQPKYAKQQLNISLEDAFNGIKNKKITICKKKLFENDFIVKNDDLICFGFARKCISLFIPNDIMNEIYKYIHYYTLPDCSKCNGSGFIKVMKTIGFMTFQQREECDKCNGEGCSDIRTINVTQIIDIPAGINIVKIEHQNHETNNTRRYKSFNLFVKWEKHKIFSTDIDGRKENLLMQCNITLKQALLGFNSNLIKIKHLNGKYLTLSTLKRDDNIIKVIQPDSCFVIKGYGMPYYRKGNSQIQYGDLTIKFNVKLPKNKNEVIKFCDGFNIKENECADNCNFVIVEPKILPKK